MIKEIFKDRLVTVYLGDSLRILKELESESVDYVFTDPPYSTGGMVRGDRMKGTRNKYQNSETEKQYPEFSGDNRDQRAFLVWCELWMSELFRITKPGSVVGCFTDWRQLPTVTDALQVSGFVWRGIVVWDKTEAVRPVLGRFRAQAEYLVWATNGARSLSGPALPGVFRESVFREPKRHMTEKPVALMREILKISQSPDDVILDPFMGSATTLKAAQQLGRRAIGIEINEKIAKIGIKRLRESVQPELV